jgi:hypothetical protein
MRRARDRFHAGQHPTPDSPDSPTNTTTQEATR